MASSKTPRPSNKKSLIAEDSRQFRVAVAYSGGLDSTALLHSAIAAHGSENVIALHVNHGLQKQADRWLLHCANQAKQMDVEFDFRLLELGSQENSHRNIEAQARLARYQALREMCEAHQIKNLLLAHHQDDQAETVMLQLMRGSGIAGLSAMPSMREEDGDTLRLWRPFLDLSRADIESYAKEYHLEWIEDPSNTDERFARNALRKRVMPILEKIQPQVKQNLSRTASHLAQAQHLLECLAEIDLNGMQEDHALKIKPLLALRAEDPARATNAMRRWLQKMDLAMPSEERINSWWKDLEASNQKVQAQIEWVHDGHLLKIWRGVLSAVKQEEFSGRWIYQEIGDESDEFGIPKELFDAAMKAGKIHELPRQGGEKMRIHPKRPRRILKNLFQELDVPPWQREAPILYLGDEILAVSGIGMNADISMTRGPRIAAHWVKD
jgi:tRNA(Ile)-lysidine synthase